MMCPTTAPTIEPEPPAADTALRRAVGDSAPHRRPMLLTAALKPEDATTTQALTLKLEGITAGDYLTWVRDPEPPALDRDLVGVAVRANPLDDTIRAELSWRGTAPGARGAATAAGFQLTPEVVAVDQAVVVDQAVAPAREPAARAA